MNISRKEFFRESIASLGEAFFTMAGALNGSPPPFPETRADMEYLPAGRPGMVAVADNNLCLAGGCGCFTCIERCETRAIHLLLGTGIRVDESACTGCGFCESLCPVTPKAVVLKDRIPVDSASASRAEEIPMKGD